MNPKTDKFNEEQKHGGLECRGGRLVALTRTHGLFWRRDGETDIVRIYTVEEYEADLASFREEETEVFTLLYPNPMDIAFAIRDLYGDRVVLNIGGASDMITAQDLMQRSSRFNMINMQNSQGSGGFGGGIGGGIDAEGTDPAPQPRSGGRGGRRTAPLAGPVARTAIADGCLAPSGHGAAYDRKERGGRLKVSPSPSGTTRINRLSRLSC